MMADLHSNAPTYADNTMAVMSLYNPYPASGLIINNPSRTKPLLEESNYAPQTTLTLNTTSLISMRKQMDESNHKMVNMLTQQIGKVFNPLI